MAVPQNMDETVADLMEQIPDVPVPQVAEHNVDGSVPRDVKDRVVRVFPQEGQIVEVSVLQVAGQFVASFVAVPQILKESVDVVSLSPHMHISDRFYHQVGGVAVPQVASLSHVSPNLLWLYQCFC